jgi:hypothetical protein
MAGIPVPSCLALLRMLPQLMTLLDVDLTQIPIMIDPSATGEYLSTAGSIIVGIRLSKATRQIKHCGVTIPPHP